VGCSSAAASHRLSLTLVPGIGVPVHQEQSGDHASGTIDRKSYHRNYIARERGRVKKRTHIPKKKKTPTSKNSYNMEIQIITCIGCPNLFPLCCCLFSVVIKYPKHRDHHRCWDCRRYCDCCCYDEDQSSWCRRRGRWVCAVAVPWPRRRPLAFGAGIGCGCDGVGPIRTLLLRWRRCGDPPIPARHWEQE
jgi:hypothetical protein